LAAASLTGIVTVWSVRRRVETAELSGAILAVAVRFSPDGKLIAVRDSSGTVTLWDPRRAVRLAEPLVGGAGIVASLDFDPSGNTLVTASGDGKLRLWDVQSGKLIGGPLPASTGSGSASFFPDGKHVLGVFRRAGGRVERRSRRVAGTRMSRRQPRPDAE
jgi:WD40 repeat protein